MADFAPEIVDLPPQETIAVRGDVPAADLPAFFEMAFRDAVTDATAAGVLVVGPPFGYYPEMPSATVVVEAGFPVSMPVEEHGTTHRLVLPGGRAARAVHVGPYDTLEQTYAELQAWLAAQGLAATGPMWEYYLSDPESEPDPAAWRTEIVCPIG